MAWYEISTAEIAPRQPLDSELFNKIRNNLLNIVSFMGLQYFVPNGSFEYTTGTRPKLWDITTFTGGSASISTGAHGAYSLRFTHGGTAAGANYGGGEAWTQDYIPVACGSTMSLSALTWGSNTNIKGGMSVRLYNSSFGIISTVVVFNRTSFTPAPTTVASGSTFVNTTATKWIKVGCLCGTDGTAAGTINFDMIQLDT